MNVYDFDDTIYAGDSSVDFYKFCLRRHPSAVKYVFVQIGAYIGFKLGIYSKTQMKQIFYKYMKCVEDMDREVEIFWSIHKKNLKEWYMKDKRRDDDLIISASPEFLLKYIVRDIGAEIIGSRVDKKTGVYDGENCYGEEKTKRFYEKYPSGKIDEFYSDSYSDTPLAKLADKAYIVRGDKILGWDFEKK